MKMNVLSLVMYTFWIIAGDKLIRVPSGCNGASSIEVSLT